MRLGFVARAFMTIECCPHFIFGVVFQRLAGGELLVAAFADGQCDWSALNHSESE